MLEEVIWQAIIFIIMLWMLSGSFTVRKDPKLFKERTNIVLTGGAQGIGYELAKILVSKAKVNLIILDVVDCSKDRYIGTAKFIKCNLENFDEIQTIWNQIIKDEGRIDILINNAAIARGKTFKELSFEEYLQTIHINYLSYVKLTHLFL